MNVKINKVLYKIRQSFSFNKDKKSETSENLNSRISNSSNNITNGVRSESVGGNNNYNNQQQPYRQIDIIENINVVYQEQEQNNINNSKDQLIIQLQLENEKLRKDFHAIERKFNFLSKTFHEMKLKDIIINSLERYIINDVNPNAHYKTIDDIDKSETDKQILLGKFSRSQLAMLKLLKRKACTSFLIPSYVEVNKISINLQIKPFDTMKHEELEIVKSLLDHLEHYQRNKSQFYYN